MPTVLFINENAAIVTCPHLPDAGRGEMENTQMLQDTVCRPRCGIWRDAGLRNEEVKNKSEGKKEFTLLCFHPKNPFLPELLKKMKETGKV